MSETLGQKQERFLLAYARWLIAINEMGYRTRAGELRRSDEQAEINAIGPDGREQVAKLVEKFFASLAAKIRNNTGSGIRNSLHESGLAADTNLFFNGEVIYDGSSPHWKIVGELWESMGADHRWGGRFKDANHVSIEHEGKK